MRIISALILLRILHLLRILSGRIIGLYILVHKIRLLSRVGDTLRLLHLTHLILIVLLSVLYIIRIVLIRILAVLSTTIVILLVRIVVRRILRHRWILMMLIRWHVLISLRAISHLASLTTHLRRTLRHSLIGRSIWLAMRYRISIWISRYLIIRVHHIWSIALSTHTSD